MISILKKFAAWYMNVQDREREAYFARAVDLADLEDRIRNWERRLHPSQN